jgi:hypothetical protein
LLERINPCSEVMLPKDAGMIPPRFWPSNELFQANSEVGQF